MARHHRYSKRSRESRKALIGVTDTWSRWDDPPADVYDDPTDLAVPDEYRYGSAVR
ncbi:hypothetical protein KIH27_04980 [Mycobacterium sp. M1]|uniref:Uncharacterized protein n=1 Tax=Mycolicibacter acidiphilus TaxID=2835306 RepID=A0ABS5RF76_9MYCO|nr:hypothetical protein [Mycolicibacter acidiphilus]MBS9532942.1 hypothetical protein [Mycolicibacter acidiphilus]